MGVMDRAVSSDKLEGRLDKNGDVWLFEFNMSPVLKDPQDAPKVNDADMIRGALSIVVPYEDASPGLWDFAGAFIGTPPQPKPLPPAGTEANDETQKDNTASDKVLPAVAANAQPALESQEGSPLKAK